MGAKRHTVYAVRGSRDELPHLVQFTSHGTDDGLVSEVQVETLKVHLPVDPLITHRLHTHQARTQTHMQGNGKGQEKWTWRNEHRQKMWQTEREDKRIEKQQTSGSWTEIFDIFINLLCSEHRTLRQSLHCCTMIPAFFEWHTNTHLSILQFCSLPPSLVISILTRAPAFASAYEHIQH